MKTSAIRKLLLIVLSAGTLFAFYTVVIDFMRFYSFEGTVFKINDCIVPNPVTTPCFYGAFGFLIALIWAWRLSVDNVKGWTRHLLFVIACILIAWGNFAYSLKRYYETLATGHPVGCSGQFVSNPWITPCFIGASIFLLTGIVAYRHWKRFKG